MPTQHHLRSGTFASSNVMSDTKTKFEKAGQETAPTLVKQLGQMLRQNKKYWLVPLIVGLLVFGVILVLGGTAIAPFIYTLF